MGWIDELRRACGSPAMPQDDDGAKSASPVPVSHAIAAARLDRTHLAPDDMRSGLTIVDFEGHADDVVDAIRMIIGSPFGKTDMRYSQPCAGAVYVVGGDSDYKQVCKVIHAGASVILVVGADSLDKGESAHPRNLASLRRVADRTVRVEAESDQRIVAEVIRAVTGASVDPDVIPTVDIRDLALGVRHLDTGEEALARLALIAARDAAARDRSAIEDLLRVVNTENAKAKVEAESSRGPRLSELSGFGKAREWGLRLAEDLRAYRAGDLAWDDLDRGIMLVGPPGTGKSFFARALAAECDVELISVGYQTWAGDANRSGDSVAGNMNKSFKEWRKKAANGDPMLVFIDELDSFGKRGSNGYNESWFQTQINALLQFFDGSEPRTGIVVLGATNYIDRIDPALLRPGRLERTVEIPLPNLTEMQGIVRHHLGLDSREAAVAVRGRSPAQVAMDAREARRIARRERRSPTVDDLRAVVSASRPNDSPEHERMIALHEAGHAVRALASAHIDLIYVDLDRRETRTVARLHSEGALVDDISVGLAGRAVEEIVLGVAGTGAAEDLVGATARATALETQLGYGATGLVVVSPDEARWMPGVEKAVRRRMDDAYEDARAFVRRWRGPIERVAAALVARRYLDADEVESVVKDVPLFRVAREPEVADVYAEAIRPVGSRKGCRPWLIAA